MKQKLLCLGLLAFSLWAMDSSDEEAQKKALAHVSGKLRDVLDMSSSSAKVPPLRISSLEHLHTLPEEWKKKFANLQHPNLVRQLAETNQESGFPVNKKEFLSDIDSTIGQWGSSDERSEDLQSIAQSFSRRSNTSISRSSSQESLSSISSTDSEQLLATTQRDNVRKLVLQLMAESYESYDKKQQGKILWGKRITITAVVVLALALLANLVEIGVIITEAVLNCTGD